MLEFGDLINAHVRREEDLQAIIHCANAEFELYGRLVQGCMVDEPAACGT